MKSGLPAYDAVFGKFLVFLLLSIFPLFLPSLSEYELSLEQLHAGCSYSYPSESTPPKEHKAVKNARANEEQRRPYT